MNSKVLAMAQASQFSITHSLRDSTIIVLQKCVQCRQHPPIWMVPIFPKRLDHLPYCGGQAFLQQHPAELVVRSEGQEAQNHGNMVWQLVSTAETFGTVALVQ